MNEKVAKALNEQVIFEFDSAYLYLSLSLAMADARFRGFRHGFVCSMMKKWFMHSSLSIIYQNATKALLSAI